jgi:hypothetical protein
VLPSVKETPPAFELAESLADGYLTSDEVRASQPDRIPTPSRLLEPLQFAAESVIDAVLNEDAYSAAFQASIDAASAFGELIPPSPCTPTGGEYDFDVPDALAREIFGNPFRPITIRPEWRTGAVISMAATVYEERALPSGQFDPVLLAILADALEEAGCASHDFLGHLRGPESHIRGCWAVDAVLAKK